MLNYPCDVAKAPLRQILSLSSIKHRTAQQGTCHHDLIYSSLIHIIDWSFGGKHTVCNLTMRWQHIMRECFLNVTELKGRSHYGAIVFVSLLLPSLMSNLLFLKNKKTQSPCLRIFPQKEVSEQECNFGQNLGTFWSKTNSINIELKVVKFYTWS